METIGAARARRHRAQTRFRSLVLELNGGNGSGYAQRASALLISAGVFVLARRVLTVTRMRTWGEGRFGVGVATNSSGIARRL
jgi:hypothetical protein